MREKVYASEEYVNEAIDNIEVVYIGSGEMPEKCNLQIDPEGEVWRQKETLANFITEEDSEEITIPLTKDPFEFTSLLVTITMTKMDNKDSQFWGRIYNTNKMLMVTHLNTLFSSTEEKTISVYVKMFDSSAFTIAVPQRSYQWQSNSFYSKEYPIEGNSSNNFTNHIHFWATNAKAGAKIVVQGIR